MPKPYRPPVQIHRHPVFWGGPPLLLRPLLFCPPCFHATKFVGIQFFSTLAAVSRHLHRSFSRIALHTCSAHSDPSFRTLVRIISFFPFLSLILPICASFSHFPASPPPTSIRFVRIFIQHCTHLHKKIPRFGFRSAGHFPLHCPRLPGQFQPLSSFYTCPPWKALWFPLHNINPVRFPCLSNLRILSQCHTVFPLHRD